MKLRQIFFIISALFLNQQLWAQYDGVLSEIYLGRQPSARVEAMGKSLDLFSCDANASFFNPAVIARSKGTSFSTSYASPYYSTTKANYRNYALATSLGEYGAIAINRFNWNSGEKVVITDPSGNVTGRYESSQTITAINYAKPVIENLLVGGSINLAQFKSNKTYNAWPVDLAAIQHFDLLQNDDLKAQMALGMTFFNIFKAKMSSESVVSNFTQEGELPQILKTGLSGRFDYLKNSLIPGLDLFNIILNAEYRSVLNSADRKAIIVGGELAVTELFFIRTGYYRETLNASNAPENEDLLNEVTYGFGVQLPVQELGIADLPLYIRFDYTQLEQPSLTKNISNWEDFKVWNVNIIWNMKIFR